MGHATSQHQEPFKLRSRRTVLWAVVLVAQLPDTSGSQASSSTYTRPAHESEVATEANAVAVSYDCGTQLYQWRTAWSATKKRWCCKHVDVGCEVDPVHALASEEHEQENLRSKERHWLSGISGDLKGGSESEGAATPATARPVAERRREEAPEHSQRTPTEGERLSSVLLSSSSSSSPPPSSPSPSSSSPSSSSSSYSSSSSTSAASPPPPPPPPPLDTEVAQELADDEAAAAAAADDAEEAAIAAEVVRSDNLSELEKEDARYISKTTTTEPFDCDAAAKNWQLEWSPLKMRYCCVARGFACVKGLETLAPVRKEVTEMLRTTTTTITTTTDLSLIIRESEDGRPLTEYVPFEAGEYAAERDRDASANNTSGCSENCLFNGLEGSCEVTMRWYVTHSLKLRSDACGIAERMVHIQCPVCSSCRLPESVCQAFTTDKSGSADDSSDHPQSWGTPEDPRTLQRQIEEALRQNLVAAPRPDPCSDDPKSWNGERREHCCQKYGRGCPSIDEEDSQAFDCRLKREQWITAWSPQKKAWCCKHSNIGCPPDPRPEGLPNPSNAPQLQTFFDCSRDDVSTWTTTKRVWCCQRAKRGCKLSHDEVPYEMQGGEWLGPVPHLGVFAPRLSGHSLSPVFDCFSGTWQEWSHEKNIWCCEHKGLGLACANDGETDFVRAYQEPSGSLISLGVRAIAEHPAALLAILSAGASSFFLCLALGKGSRGPVEGLLRLQNSVLRSREASTARGGLDFVITEKVTTREPLYKQVRSDCDDEDDEDDDDPDDHKVDARDDENDLEVGRVPGRSDPNLYLAM